MYTVRTTELIHIHTYLYAYIHTYIHTYIHIYLHTYTSSYKMDKPGYARARTCCPSLFSIVQAFLTLGSMHAPQG